MAKKAKVECRAKQRGGHGVSLSLKIDDPAFGKVDADIRFDLESDRMTEITATAAKAAEARLNAMEVDPEDPGSISDYVEAITECIGGLLQSVREELSP